MRGAGLGTGMRLLSIVWLGFGPVDALAQNTVRTGRASVVADHEVAKSAAAEVDAQLPTIDRQADTTAEQNEVARRTFATVRSRLPALQPPACDGSQKIAWDGTRWGCARDLLGCPDQGLTLAGGGYSCGIAVGYSAKQGFETQAYQCTGTKCVGGEQRCPRVCYQDCNCRDVCTRERFGRQACSRQCESCAYDCSYTICRENHVFVCTGGFQCDQDEWASRGHGCHVTGVTRAACQ